MPFSSADAVQLQVSPVVMVSANALLCLAFYNRLSAVFSRSRAVHKEIVDLTALMASFGDDEHDRVQSEYLKHRTLALEAISSQLVGRARWIRRSLFCLLSAILLMLATSLTLGGAGIVTELGLLSPWLFAVGTLSTMAGIGIALQELRLSLGPLMFESSHFGFDTQVEYPL